MNKLVNSIREAISLSGLKDGMTVSFHHHLRNGDYVLNMVMDEIASSRSKITASAPRHDALISIFGLLPGKKSILRRIILPPFRER